MKDLLEIRKEIDVIDREIVRLYEERMGLTQEVAEYKLRTGKKILDREREQAKLAELSGMASSEFTQKGVRELFDHIMAISRRKQYQLMAEHGASDSFGFTRVDRFDFNGARIVFQGVAGAYSQQAMLEFFGEDCDGHQVDTWKDAMEAIKNREADYAVLPIENSSAGVVSENYDLLQAYDNYIVGEQILRIEHALLGLPEAKITDLTQIYSHPQSLMQCAGYLEEHREWEKFPMKNNAVAARKIRDDGDPGHAAIAGKINAQLYGLKVLASAIQDKKNNSTRFIIVTGRPVYAGTSRHISICFEIAHESGSLYHALGHFIYNGLNLTNIQSRPIGDRNWEYRFFVDLEGGLDDTAVRNALRGLREEAATLKILGTY